MTRRSDIKNGFTLIELMVVMAIIVILILVAVPSIKAITKGNGVVQSNNMIRAALANARAAAISQHRPAGVIFFEETNQYSNPVNRNQTAMQLMIQDPTQSSGTQFMYYSKERQYLPSGLAVATLSDDNATLFRTAGNSNNNNTARIILFDENGQMVLRSGLSTVAPSGTAGTYPQAYGDWGISTGNGVSSPGVLVYDLAAFNAENLSSDSQRTAWLQKNGVVLIVNAYTGGLIQ